MTTVADISLRDYQDTDIENIERAWTEYKSVLYQLSTGGGKSVIISKLVVDCDPNENIIIFAHKRRLLTQLRDRFAKLGIVTGMMQGMTQENLDAKVVIVSIRTAVKDRRLEALLERPWNKAIIDEARHSRTGSYDKVLDALKEKHPAMKMFGVDATPYRKDGKRLDKHFDFLVTSSKNTQALIDAGHLSKFRTFATPVGEIEEFVKELGGDYQQTELSNYMRRPEFLDYVVDLYARKGEDRQSIVFAVDKAHAKDLSAAFVKKGYTSVKMISSDMKEKEVDAVFEAFENGDLQILINIEMATEGVDLPETGCIILARPTQSLTLYLQMLGRGTRPKADGSDLIVLDCSGGTEKFGNVASPRHWSLNPEINPNNLREKNRVVGKRDDGTYTEDLTDFVGELVEMTPEEFVQHIAGGMQSAEKTNATIDERILALIKAILAIIEKLIKDKTAFRNFDVDFIVNPERKIYQIVFYESKHKEDYLKSVEPGSWNNFKQCTIVIDIKPTGATFAKLLVAGYSSVTESNLQSYMSCSILLGELNKTFLENPKGGARIKEMAEQVKDLEQSKIDIDEFKDAAKKFEQEQWEKAVRQHATVSKVFMLPNSVSYGSYFKGYDYNNIVGIEIPSGSINTHHNKVILLKKDRWSREEDTIRREEKSYVKGDKVLEIIKDGKWVAEVK